MPKILDIADALQIVLDLARQGILDERDAGGELDLKAERERQIYAIAIVEDLAVNQFGDD